MKSISGTLPLFDGWAVVREWGRIGQPGTVREMWFETESAATKAGEQVRQQKEKRGYRSWISVRIRAKKGDKLGY